MHGPLNIKPLSAPVGYRNLTIQTVAAISRIALSIQESNLIVSLTLNMSEHFFFWKKPLPSAENGCNISQNKTGVFLPCTILCRIPWTLRNTNTVIQSKYFPILNRFNLRLILQEIHSMWDACIINNTSRNSVVIRGSYILNPTDYVNCNSAMRVYIQHYIYFFMFAIPKCLTHI